MRAKQEPNVSRGSDAKTEANRQARVETNSQALGSCSGLIVTTTKVLY